MRALQAPELGSAAAVAAQLSAQRRSSWRVTMSLLLEAWALQMYLLRGAATDVSAVQGVMDRLGIEHRQCKRTAADRIESSWVGLLDGAGQSDKRRKSKESKRHSKRSRRKHKRERSDSADSEELLLQDHAGMEQAPELEWELDGVHGATGRFTCRYPALPDVLVAHALTRWSRHAKSC